MNLWKALFLGILQGLTEFLPISSSGHLELLQTLMKIPAKQHLEIELLVHVATTLSILTVFRKDIWQLRKDTQYIFWVLLAAIPVGIVGVFFKDKVELLFQGHFLLLSVAWLITALFLFATRWYRNGKSLNFWRVLVIGIAQALAVIPGISRSGTTISTALLLGINKTEAARFSFLIAIIPIMGAAILGYVPITLPPSVALTAFLSAYIAGYFACKWMITLVQRIQIHYFAYYCIVLSIIAFLLR